MTRALHPDFERAPETYRWSGSLDELYQALVTDAFRLQGREAWRILPGGALVSLRVRPEDYRKELRIARSTAPAGDAATTAWGREVNTFLDHFGGRRMWRMTAGPQPAEGAACYFVSLFEAEVGAEVPTCAKCGGPAPGDWRVYKAPICHACALALGGEEAAAIRAHVRLRG